MQYTNHIATQIKVSPIIKCDPTSFTLGHVGFNYTQDHKSPKA